MSVTEYKTLSAELDHDLAFRRPAGEFKASSKVRAGRALPRPSITRRGRAEEPVRLVRAPAEFGKPAPIAVLPGTENTVALRFSFDGKRLLTNQVNLTSTLSFWDMATGQRTLTLPVQPIAVSSTALSRNGKQLATASLEPVLKLWDAITGQQLRSLTPVTTVFTALAFSPDGKWLAADGHDQAVIIWDIAGGTLKKSLRVERYFISGMDFSPDGKHFASPALDGFKVWDTETWGEIYFPQSKTATLRQGGRVVFTPDGRRLVTATDDGIRVWDREARREIVAQPAPPLPVGPRGAALSHDGDHAVTADGNGTVRLWYLSPVAVPSACEARPHGRSSTPRERSQNAGQPSPHRPLRRPFRVAGDDQVCDLLHHHFTVLIDGLALESHDSALGVRARGPHLEDFAFDVEDIPGKTGFGQRI